MNKYVVMGVSGCGKSSIGSNLAKALNIPFFDGDDYHPKENVKKMQIGIPLTDADRQSWLETLNQLIKDHQQLVVACSALKPEYREVLRKDCRDLQFVYLKGDFETIWFRHQQREDHYFNGYGMLLSQFDTLIEPTTAEAFHVNIDQSPEEVVASILTHIHN